MWYKGHLFASVLDIGSVSNLPGIENLKSCGVEHHTCTPNGIGYPHCPDEIHVNVICNV